MARFRRVLPAVVVLGLVLSLSLVAPKSEAQTVSNVVSTNLVSSTSASGSSSIIALQSQSNCTVLAFTSTGTATITVNGSAYKADPVTSLWLPNANFGSSGNITATTTPTATSGNVANYPGGFYFSWVGNTGTITAVASCSTAVVAGGGGGGGGNVTVINTPGVTVQNTPGVTIQNTPGVNVQNTAAPVPLPTASAGAAPPANAPPVVAFNVCQFPAGAAPVVTAGNSISTQCDANGNQKVTVINTPGVTVQNTAAPIPLPTASAGVAPPANAPPVVAHTVCVFPAGNAPTVTAGNTIATQCDVSGNTKVTVQNTPGVAIVTSGTPIPVTTPSPPVNAMTGGAQNVAPAAGQSLGQSLYDGTSMQPAFLCPNRAVINLNTTTATQIIALAASKRILICTIVLQAASAVNVTLEEATAASCGGTVTAISGAMPEGANTGFSSSGFGGVQIVDSGDAFCILASAAVQVSGWVLYAQF